MLVAKSFQFPEHRTCGTLTRLTLEYLPKNRSFGRRRSFRKNSEVWHPDDRGDRIYFLEQGRVDIFSGDPQARGLLLQSASAGEPIGELCFCAEGNGQRNTVACALTDITVLEIPYEGFIKYLQQTQRALNALLCTFCLRLSDCESATEILAHRGSQERLGRLLLNLADRAAKASGLRTPEVILQVSHVDLARMGAISRPHVTVTLGYFRQQQLIQYARGRPLVVNREALGSYLRARGHAITGRKRVKSSRTGR